MLRKPIRSLEEDLQELGLTDKDLDEQIRIKRKRKKKRRRPKKRLKAAEKARAKIRSRKYRRTSAGKKKLKLRAKAMKLAKKRGMKPGQISIRTSDMNTTNTNSLAESVERLTSLEKSLALSEKQIELRQGFTSAQEVIELIKDKLDGLREDVAASTRKEIDEYKEDLEEYEALVEFALEKIMENELVVKKDDKEICLEQALEELTKELNDYTGAIAELEKAT